MTPDETRSVSPVNWVGKSANGGASTGEMSITFGRIDGKLVRKRPYRECLDDITDWCHMELHQLVKLAQTHSTWWQTASRVLDTNRPMD